MYVSKLEFPYAPYILNIRVYNDKYVVYVLCMYFVL